MLLARRSSDSIRARSPLAATAVIGSMRKGQCTGSANKGLRNLYLNPLLALPVHWPLRMDPMTAVAASGLRARMESLDLLANNIANASTGGYKADREFYSLYAAPETAGNDPSSTMPLIERPWVDHTQGVLRTTGNPLDVALSGKGFFAVNGP